MLEEVSEVLDEADCDRTNRSGRLTERALTLLALLIQEAEQAKAHGRFALELDFQSGVIQRIRRVQSVTEV
ncbi:MAG: hypothetical protein GX575_14795 [Candidatus Anammoximicrobium sp.]|nr:hypothetical protein [Candidatus Anammoximicrobium sp.]